MPLEAGKRLRPYAVTAKIGEGSMGEMYRARDTKLDPDVVLKVLPHEEDLPGFHQRTEMHHASIR